MIAYVNGILESIEEGLVVDLCSVYDNKVTLKVGGKTVADGELVIINDRFGVRIKNVTDSETSVDTSSSADAGVPEEEIAQGSDDFDYSDFEVEENGADEQVEEN